MNASSPAIAAKPICLSHLLESLPPDALPDWSATVRRLLGTELLAAQRELLTSGFDPVGCPAPGCCLAAPTGSGKSALAMLAALGPGRPGAVGLYLAATRSLAREVAARLRAAAPPSRRIALTTAEDREDDGLIADAAADVIVTVPERALALIDPPSGVRRALGVAVVDEAALIADAERGPRMELVLLALRRRASALVVLGSMAPLLAHLARWLDLPLHASAERPQPLSHGVLDLDAGAIEWIGPAPDFAWPSRHLRALGPGAAIAAWMGEDDERRALAFVPRRRLAWRLAEAIARGRAGVSPAPAPALPDRCDGAAHRLRPLLAAGVGVHTRELPSAWRAHVESAFAGGALRVVCATPTLAHGVNLRVPVVFHVPPDFPGIEAEPPECDHFWRFIHPEAAGRAGRPDGGSGHGGVSIVLAADARHARDIRRRLEARAPADGAVWQVPWSLAHTAEALRLAGRCELDAEADSLLDARFLSAAREEADSARALIATGEEAGLWRRQADGVVRLRLEGRVLAAIGVEGSAARVWARALRAPRPRHPGEAACWLVASALADRCVADLPRTISEPCPESRADWPAVLGPRGRSASARVRVARAVLGALGEGPEALPDIETRLGLLGGTIEDLAREAHRLADVLGGCARGAGNHALADAAERLAGTLNPWVGAPAVATPPADSPAALEPVPVPPRAAGKPPATRLRIEPLGASMGQVEFDGRAVDLTPLQFALLVLLARRGEAGASYAEIDAVVWPDAKVQRQMVAYHRRELETRLAGAEAPSGSLIETRHRWGLRLRLAPGEMELTAPAGPPLPAEKVASASRVVRARWAQAAGAAVRTAAVCW